jgi:hypothetical protein
VHLVLVISSEEMRAARCHAKLYKYSIYIPVEVVPRVFRRSEFLLDYDKVKRQAHGLNYQYVLSSYQNQAGSLWSDESYVLYELDQNIWKHVVYTVPVPVRTRYQYFSYHAYEYLVRTVVRYDTGYYSVVQIN